MSSNYFHTLSYWERESHFASVDICIIGAGIVGLSTAISLKESKPSLKILVLERGVLPYGASTRNAGFACFGSPSELLDDLSKNSEEEVFALVEKRWEGLKLLRNRLGDATIDYEGIGNFEAFSREEEPLYNQCLEKLHYLNGHIVELTGQDNVYKVTDEKIISLGFKKIEHLICNKLEGQLNSGKMMTSLLKKVREMGVEVLNGIEVSSIETHTKGVSICSAEGIAFTSSRVAITTNAFAKQFLPDIELQPGRAQVLITKPVPGLKLKGSFHADRGYYYFRNVGDRVLLGGGRNLDFKNEETAEFGTTKLVQDRLDQMLKEVILPGTEYEIDMRWSGIMGLGNTKKTIIKEADKNIFCAIRCGGMGVALGSLSGKELSKLLLDS